MSSRNLFASILMTCSLAVALLCMAPAANAADSGGPSVLKAGKRSNVITVKPRVRGVRIHLPIGPTSVYYDYPYYYCRGHYPTHIGGYVYYPHHYYHRRIC